MNEQRLLKVLLAPHITEKSSVAAEINNQYVFKVTSDATKPEIKKAVENLFDVKVNNVRVTNIKGKIKRSGANFGRRGDTRKAYVTLEQGQEINFLGSE